uniref:(northern house mosquito) hypothetical protein n=1 Tax=Culex pipiens TaxID=7175 RepID=A0A8D8BK39_CULPI
MMSCLLLDSVEVLLSMTISGTDSGIIATDSGTVSGVSLTSMKGIDSSTEASCFSSTTASITDGTSLTSSITASATSSSASTSKNSSSPLETEIVSRNSSSTKLLSDCSCSSGTGVIIGGVSIRNSSFSSSRPLSKKGPSTTGSGLALTCTCSTFGTSVLAGSTSTAVLCDSIHRRNCSYF